MGDMCEMMSLVRYARREIRCHVDIERPCEVRESASVAFEFVVGFATVNERILRPFVASLCPAVL